MELIRAHPRFVYQGSDRKHKLLSTKRQREGKNSKGKVIGVGEMLGEVQGQERWLGEGSGAGIPSSVAWTKEGQGAGTFSL